MIVYAKDVPHLPKLQYFQLPESVRPLARQAVLDQEVKAIKHSLLNTLKAAKKNVNVLVNDRYHISKILRDKKHVQSLNDIPKFENFIDSNLCHFLDNGAYVLYSSRTEIE